MATEKRRVFRKRHSSNSDSEEAEQDYDTNSLRVQDIKRLQKLRGRPNGVNAVGLALGKATPKTEIENNDPFKLQTGGFVDMKALNLRNKPLQADDVEAIGTAFAAETNIRDEDAEMLRYVEEELAKKKGHTTQTTQEKQKQEEDQLYQLPENLRVGSSTKRSEDMLSNQMLSGIPEVDLGIDSKIKNIESTEDSKQKLLREMMMKKDSEVSEFVPTNMAVNFVQHNRFNIEESGPKHKKVLPIHPKLKPLRVGDAEKLETPQNEKRRLTVEPEEKATDDFYYERFKKQMRRY